ncbi:MAG: EamA family transporter [Rhodospirillales bacterium]|nr:EamA family transporter [Rhodospirillales bacterium]
MEKNNSQQINSLKMIAAMAIAGSVGVFVLESGQSAFNVAFYRCVFGALSLGLLCIFSGKLKREYFTMRSLRVISIGGAFLVYNWALLFKAYSLTSISIATIVYHVNPFIILFLGLIFFRDRFDFGKLVWTLVAFVGLISVVGIPDVLVGDHMLGIGLTLAATTLYSFTVVFAKWLKEIPSEFIAFIQVSVGAVLLLPFTNLGDVPASGFHWYYLIGLGVLHTCIEYALLYSAFQKLSMALIAILSFIYPVVAVLLDYLFYGRVLEVSQWAGIAAIVIATLGVKLEWQLGARGKKTA